MIFGKGWSLRLDHVLGQETTHPFLGGHRRHNQLRAQSGMRCLTALHFHRESRGENVCVLPKMIVRVGVFVEILE